VMGDLSRRFRLLINPFVQQAKQAAAGVIRIQNLSDSDIGEVKSSAETFASVVDDTAGFEGDPRCSAGAALARLGGFRRKEPASVRPGDL
jgi:hypothetical protein